MSATTDYYLNNPLIHRNRRLGDSASEWVSSFCCADLKPLIICRGPIRKEAMDVFDEMGVDGYGILLSEKDSITYPNALSPELRQLTNPQRIHRVPDYTGATKEERSERIQQIISIAHDNGYNAIFAGYGFMAEDEEMVAAMENAGLNFIGPCSGTVHSAGLKDEAKRTALKVGVSVTPGVDNASALTLLAKCPDSAALLKLAIEHKLDVDESALRDDSLALEDRADRVLAASYAAGIDLYTIDELAAQIELSARSMYEKYPENRIRLKAIGGGGGKGQRILAAPSAYQGDDAARIREAAAKAPELVREILNEVKTTGVGDNKNVLVELNIESTRHQEIQVVGNGDWCITMGARDCSLQMHEQKLLEVSSTHESIAASLVAAKDKGVAAEIATLEKDLVTLDAMEDEAARFGEAVGLDSVSTFECIVDRGSHFFMEMNTRIQVEHRVTELCYGLRFANPDNPSDSFQVESLVEAMVLLARHGQRLPKPERVVRENASVEARLNATNSALQPHAGGMIGRWSQPIEGEIRDDQGISLHNPDTGVFMKYRLAGAYDSNIALLLTVGHDRLDSYLRLAEILRRTNLIGEDLCTNLEFHYGLTNWFIGTNVQARPTTKFIVPYLTAVGLLQEAASNIDLDYAFRVVRDRALHEVASDSTIKKGLAESIDRKQTLLLRPLAALLQRPHALSGWLSLHRKDFSVEGNSVCWLANPVRLLEDLYRYLNMEYRDGRPAQNMIWGHDFKILFDATAFYSKMEAGLGSKSFAQLSAALADDSPAAGFDAAEWPAIRAAHRGYQSAMAMLDLLPYLALSTDFYALSVNDNLDIHIPERLLDGELQSAMQTVLVPPLVAKSDEILAASGGMFYPREAPGMEVYLNEGDHFEEGDVLYIVEVMKMFNKITAPFAGTVQKILVEEDGVIIAKGQPLFKVKPDVEVVIESAETIAARKRQQTDVFLQTLGA